jgi:hypothetical protein
MSRYGPAVCVCGSYMQFSDCTPLYYCPNNCESYRAGRDLYYSTPLEVWHAADERIPADKWLEQLTVQVDRDRLIGEARD